MVAVLLATFLSAMDGTAVTTIMPTAVRSLGGFSLYSWVFAVYMLTTAVTMPLWGKLADVRGSRGLFILSIAIFVVGSALSGAAPTMVQLVIYRALQGVGAGGMGALTYTIIGVTMPPDRRARSAGLIAAIWGVASVVGPPLGGAITALIGWRWVFYINVPLGVLAIWLSLRFIPIGAATNTQQKIDWLGGALVAAAVSAMLLMLQVLASGSPLAPWLGGAAVVLLAVFIFVENRTTTPILAPFLFRSRLFAIPNAIAFLSCFAVMGALDYLPLLVPPGMPSAAGAAILVFPASAAWSLSSFLCSRFVYRAGVRPVAIGGLVMMSFGFAFFLLVTSAHSGIWWVALASIPIGLGMGPLTPALVSAVQNALHMEHMGMGTATQQLLRQLGGTFGVSAMQLVLLLSLAGYGSGAAQNILAGGSSLTQSAFSHLVGGVHLAFVLALAAAVLGLLLSFTISRTVR